MEPIIRKYIVRLFENNQEVCFYNRIYFVPPVVPRIGEAIGLVINGQYRSYIVCKVFYDFPDEENEETMFIDLYVDWLNDDDNEADIKQENADADAE